MEVIFEGRLSHQLRIDAVLRRIIAQGPQGQTFLQISCDEFNGSVLISNSRFIQGASINDCDELGYEAVRRLLATAAGDFAFVKAGSQDLPVLESDLNLALEQVLKYVPDLPPSYDQLFDEKSLLDRVFDTGGAPVPAAPETAAAPQSAPKRKATLERNMWKLLQPLSQEAEFDDEEEADQTIKSETGKLKAPYALPTPPKEKDTPLPQSKAKSWAFSPVLAITIVGLLLAVELMVIIFWKPLMSTLGPSLGHQSRNSSGGSHNRRSHRNQR